MEPAPKPCMQSMALPIPHTWPSSPPGGKHEVEDGRGAAPPAGVGGSQGEPRALRGGHVPVPKPRVQLWH